MADDLDALRRQHREDRLRKRERERQEQRKEGQRRKEIERSRLNSIRSRKRKQEFEKEQHNNNNNNDNHCEILSTSEAARRKRIQRLKEEKKAEDALKMLQKLYPDTMSEASNVFSNEKTMTSSRSNTRLKRQKNRKRGKKG